MSRSLPPLRALRAFESAARHRSFTRAGEELHVTAAAISQQVRGLEQWLGFALFDRLPNGLQLTERGAEFLPSVTGAFDSVSMAVRTVRERDRIDTLTIAARPNFAVRWLLPRLQTFQSDHPDLDIRLYIGSRFPDPAGAGHDAVILSSDEPGAQQGEYLFSPRLIPVCSPGFQRRHTLTTPSDLQHCPLIQMVNSLDDWPRWLQAAGVDPMHHQGPRTPSYDTYTLSLEAAGLGHGIAMARDAFVERDLAEGRLLAPFDLRVEGRKSWFLLRRPNAPERRVGPFRDWLLAQAHAYRVRSA